MIIEPKVREYICTTAHPQGCAESVRNQADYACKQGMVNGTKKALVIGCSTGYGLASRICALENCGADTLGIMFERQANGRRTATPGWYNTAEFHRLASGKGVYAKTINGDAFSKEIKEKAIELIKGSWKSGPGSLQPGSTETYRCRRKDLVFLSENYR